MKKLNSAELRRLWLKFFSDRGHTVIPSASLIPENDATVLFTTAGMHPLVPYLLGAKHPGGKRLANVQACVRTGDIEEVGDATHCTFFEMLGNWSLGDYFKEQSVKQSYELLTGVLEIPVDRLAVTVFEGDGDAPRDEESARLWRECGIPEDKIFYLPKKHNWWIAGASGPCGPDTEMFIDTGKERCGAACSPACDCGKYIEIGNNVFMEFYKEADGSYRPLEQKNVDTGMGLERNLCILNGFKSVYDTDLFASAVAEICALSGKIYGEGGETDRAVRIIADHVRTSVFLIGDAKGIVPSNVDQGYVLRRLIRRAVRYGRMIGLERGALTVIAEIYIDIYKDAYPYLWDNRVKILDELLKEEEKFLTNLQQGLKEFEKVITHIPTKTVSGKTAFRLYDTFGFPLEMTVELAMEKGFDVDEEGYRTAYREHQLKSQTGAEQKFKGGLADNGEATVKLHTATHLMHAALAKVLGRDIVQRGSNITEERLRFDFGFDRPMTEDEIVLTEKLVNEVIEKGIDVTVEEMTVEEAKAQGAAGVFDSRYGERVKVYTVGDFSKEICGGPHVKNTAELVNFKIQKEQSSSSGVRRIKAAVDCK